MNCFIFQPIGPIQCIGTVIDTEGHGIPQGGTFVYTLGEIITYDCVKRNGNTMHGVGTTDTSIQIAKTFAGSLFFPNPNGAGGLSFTIGVDQQPALTCPKSNQVVQIKGTELTTQTTQYIPP